MNYVQATKASTYMFCKVNLRFLSLVRYYNQARGALKPISQKSKLLHCYKQLFPWKNEKEFSEYLISSVVYNKDGLIALNKPFGIKIHSHDKPGTRCENKNQRYVIPSIAECDYTVEDSLPILQEHFNLPDLRILKSAEKYTSGVVLLGSSDKVAAKLTKSFNIAKLQHKPHLVHWAITAGYSAAPFRQEKVGIKFLEAEDGKERQPVIVTDVSKRACKLKKVYPVQVECRNLMVNEALSTSLVQISSSSVKWHFVRVYACSRVAPLLGDIMYGSRMKSLYGIPVKVQLQNSFAYGVQLLPDKIYEVLSLPKGESGTKMIPTMLHLRSIILPNFEEKDNDLIITAEAPLFFQWTAEKLNLFEACK